ncbi:hypothetical protein D9M72_137810 [compost metagenome]
MTAVPMPSCAIRTITLSAELPYMRGASTPACCSSWRTARCGSVVEEYVMTGHSASRFSATGWRPTLSLGLATHCRG